MGRSQKSKRITWASDANLCQVRLFLSGESPSQIGFGTQDRLQAKALWSGQAGVNEPDDTLPPGFEGIQPANVPRVKLSQMPLAKWRCPPRLGINSEWQVVAGDESREREAENQRQMRVLEAIYPRPSAIPPNPIVVADVQNSTADDRYTPLVPVTPIEEEDPAALDTSNPNEPHANRISAAVTEPDTYAAAKAILTSVISNSSSDDKRNMIDSDLLIKILNNPKMVEQLITLQNRPSSKQLPTFTSSDSYFPSYSTHSSSTRSIPPVGVQRVAPYSSSVQHIPDLRSQSKNSFVPTEIAMNRIDSPSAHPPRQEFATPSGVATATAPFYQPQIRTGPFSTDAISSSGAPVTKDVNYYKSLIKQHGEESREALPRFAHSTNQPPNQEPFNFMKSGELRPKITKPCVYYNSPKGCRNGANCAYQHSMLMNQKRINGFAEVQNTKRVKLDRGITGT